MTEKMEWLDLKKCGICGKRFSVLYPTLWRYKRGTRYLCSWRCLRIFDGEGAEEAGKEAEEMEKRSWLDVAMKVIENGKAGKPAAETLAELGYKNPAQAATDVRKFLKEKQPALFEQWPAARRKRKDEPEKETVTEPEAVKAPDLKMAPVPEPANRMDVKLIPDGFQVTAIRGKTGEYTHDAKHGTVDLRTPDGQELSLLPKEWAQLAGEIGRMLKILGVE